MKTVTSGFIIAVCLAALVGCGEETMAPERVVPTTIAAGPTSSRPAPVYGTVKAGDQSSDGRSVVVAMVELRGMAGYVVIHAESQGGAGDVMGHAAVPEGVTKNVKVTLDHQAASGPYWAMLHRDADPIGVFNWPGGRDGPVRAPTGNRFGQHRFVLQVAE